MLNFCSLRLRFRPKTCFGTRVGVNVGLRRYWRVVRIFLACVWLAACGYSQPDCGNKQSADEVINIISDNESQENSTTIDNLRRILSLEDMTDKNMTHFLLRKRFSDQFFAKGDEIIKQINPFELIGDYAVHKTDSRYEIDSIRLVEKNETTQAVTCDAIAHLDLGDRYGKASAAIRFKVELTTEHKFFYHVFQTGYPY